MSTLPAFAQRVLSNPIMLIFTVLAVGNFIAGLRLGRVGWQGRSKLLQEPLRPAAKRWADRSAILLGVPVGVLVHEFCHALATWLFHGSIVEYGYFFYWGYVVPVGEFTPAQEWFISLAGTLGTLAYGLAVWLLLRNHRASLMRYLGLRIFRFQIYFALVYYPLFTLFTFVGDWRVIYDYRMTPLLSGLTFIIHLTLLALFVRIDRRGQFEMPAFDSVADQQAYEHVLGEVRRNPQNVAAWQSLVDSLRRGGASNRAKSELQTLLKMHPDDATAHLLYALLLGEGRRQIPRRALSEARRALALGLPNPEQAARAYGLVATYELEVGQIDEALRDLDLALTGLSGKGNSYEAHLRYLRSRAYRRKGSNGLAQSDIAEAIRLADSMNNVQAAAQYRQQEETIRRHAGR